jgi:ATP-dependent Lhr-like helicase
LSLERLEALRAPGLRPLQRIGLSATQRPLAEAARLLGGGVPDPGGGWVPRPVTLVDAGAKKPLELTIEVPVDDLARLGSFAPPGAGASGAADLGPSEKSIWPSLHPRLVELVRQHRSTLIFVNSRRLAERLASAINETSGLELARAHHGSLAKEQRSEIEDQLKAGRLPALVATSSLELGIDMGAVDLVVQIEAPPSVASGLQRVGRAGHQVEGLSRGVFFPKYRGDLLASAAVVEGMRAGAVESTAYPRNPLDVLAQQIVASCALDTMAVEELFCLVRRAAPFAELPRAAFEGVLDLLSGRYPSDEFAALRPRVTWDRTRGLLRGRPGAQRLAVTSGGTIPDRGLYGVFLHGAPAGKSVRVGELDEEMVFESRPGEVFLLGASSWRIEDITHDRVLVTPAPGVPGKMPFWHGDRAGRALELGRAVGALTRSVAEVDPTTALDRLRSGHGMDERAAKNLLAYVRDQQDASELPTDKQLVLERFIDEVGDRRVCLLSPFGSRVHAPWAMAAAALLRERYAGDVDTLWSDDGIVFRLPDAFEPPSAELFLPDPDEVEALVTRELAGTSLFASRFRENAARALLLPRRRPGQRSPLWAQRRRAADLLQVAAQYPSFPILLETYRECLRDVFDLPGLVELLKSVRSRRLRVATLDVVAPSPFAASLSFSYVANFMYAGDAPLAERRAQALTIDQGQLQELLGEVELRELLDLEVIHETERALQHLARPARNADGVHDLLLDLGDLSLEALAERVEDAQLLPSWLESLALERRVYEITLAGEARFIAVEDTAKYRDALGVVPPRGVPAALLAPVPHALEELASRYARTHTPFAVERLATRWGLGVSTALEALTALVRRGRLASGAFLPGGTGTEFCDVNVLRQLKQKTLLRLRREVEPVEPDAYARFLLGWHEVVAPRRRGLDGILAALEQLQGFPLPASVLLDDVLPARVRDFSADDLDLLCARGEVAWQGVEALGPHDGRIVLFLADRRALGAPAPRRAEGALAEAIRSVLAARGALFFADILLETRAFAPDVLVALWDLVWAGEATNDTLAPLRSLIMAARSSRRERPSRRVPERSRRVALPGTEGRWALIPRASGAGAPSETERRLALVEQLLERYGVVTREAVQAEGVPGGFSAIYPLLKTLEESGRLRRGYFVGGLGATQFARAGAEERLRQERAAAESTDVVFLSAADPANPYGAQLAWPSGEPRPQRASGAHVFLHSGRLIAYLPRGERQLATFLPEAESERARTTAALAERLAALVDSGARRALWLEQIDGVSPERHSLADALTRAGFQPASQGWLKRAHHARR